MFVQSMTFEEIRKEFNHDFPHLVRRVHESARLMKKNMRKYKISRVEKFNDYVSPRKNRWMIDFRYDTTKDKDMSVGVWGHYLTDRSYAVISHDIVRDYVFHYTSHFFTRYFERTHMEKDNPPDIIRQYSRDTSLTAQQPIKEVSPGVWQVFSQQTKGVALGYFHQDLRLYEFRTFIDHSLLKGNQIKLSILLEEKFKLPVMRMTKNESMNDKSDPVSLGH